MDFPKGVKTVAVSTTIKPVTQTALTEVNRASRNDNGCIVAFGSINNPLPIAIINKKLKAKIMEGERFNLLKKSERWYTSVIISKKEQNIMLLFESKKGTPV
jgi:hypothetical protein